MDAVRLWDAVVHLSLGNLLVLAILTTLAFVGAITAMAMYGRLVRDEWLANRSRNSRRKAWIEGHTRVTP
jgi:cytochrome b